MFGLLREEQHMTASQDQSMEEILQSIKRIIAEEGEDDTDESAMHAPINGKAGKESTSILELSDAIEEDDEPLELEDVVDEGDLEEDASFAEDEPEQEFAIIPPEMEIIENEAHADEVYEELAKHMEIESTSEMDSLTETSDTPLIEEDVPSQNEDSLISDDVAKHTASAFHKVVEAKHKVIAKQSQSQLHFRSGTTIEDLTLELLKPVMKEWLDIHLQPIVERLVAQEVKRLSESE